MPTTPFPATANESHNDMTSLNHTITPRLPGRLFVLLGLCLTFLGIAGYVVQIALGRLLAPWYMPALATLGVVLVVISLWERRTVWRHGRTVGGRLSRGCRVGNVVRIPTAGLHRADHRRAAIPGVRNSASRRHAVHADAT